MPGTLDKDASARKRKRARTDDTSHVKQKRKVHASQARNGDDRIALLESQIIESRTHYNNIAELLQIVRTYDKDEGTSLASVSLCRIFSRLMASGSMTKHHNAPDTELIVVQWLKERYEELCEVLMEKLKFGSFSKQQVTLTLLMRLLKTEATQLRVNEDVPLPLNRLSAVFQAIVQSPDGKEIREEFVKEYVSKYDDIRFYTFANITVIASMYEAGAGYEDISSALLSILCAVEKVPSSNDELVDFYAGHPRKGKQLLSLNAHKRQAQDAWLALMRSGLTKDQRKQVLGLISHQIAPWFLKVELLMDFLTDSYNIGGATSLLALSGLFFLIREKNLDYPLFYHKLYSLLDRDILHSRHRSRFFRNLDTFLASTHLPAALVASFVKRLSRLTLYGPPGGIVVAIPWIYNLLKKHPSCTFMIHREGDASQYGVQDTYNMMEEDPMNTCALESSLWELETLRTHYHPNVATLAKIISEQFTKQAYNLEDFLDHSYSSMLDAELSKDTKKTPVVEFEIPKKILTKVDTESMIEDTILVKLWKFT